MSKRVDPPLVTSVCNVDLSRLEDKRRTPSALGTAPGGGGGAEVRTRCGSTYPGSVRGKESSF